MDKMLISMLLIWSACCGTGYTQQALEALRIGDRVPDTAIAVINHTGKTVSLAQFRGKLVILDFYTRYCKSCIQKFPLLEELQEKYKDRVVILPVGFEDPSGTLPGNSIALFYEEREKRGKPMKLPSLVQQMDSTGILYRLFPFRTVPVVVWIDFRGCFVGMTDAVALNEATITAFLEQQVQLEADYMRSQRRENGAF